VLHSYDCANQIGLGVIFYNYLFFGETGLANLIKSVVNPYSVGYFTMLMIDWVGSGRVGYHSDYKVFVEGDERNSFLGWGGVYVGVSQFPPPSPFNLT